MVIIRKSVPKKIDRRQSFRNQRAEIFV